MAEPSTNTLQLLIEKRADARLNKDIADMLQLVISKMPLLYPATNFHRSLLVKYKDSATEWDKVSIKPLRDVLLGKPLADELRAIHRAQYIQEETNAFINKVDSLAEQLEQLQSEVDSITT